jgi:hypothetical protein
MAEGDAPPQDAPPAEPDKPAEQTVPYERFQQANTKAKEAVDRAKALEKSVADLKAAMEERENAGLPELDRERKRAEALEKRVADAEAKAADSDAKLARSAKSSLVRSAAKDFADPDDAVAFVDLDGIEDDKDAERAVKALAKRKPHLLKPEDTKLPGKVLSNGHPTSPATAAATAAANQRLAEAEMLAEGLKQFATPS